MFLDRVTSKIHTRIRINILFIEHTGNILKSLDSQEIKKNSFFHSTEGSNKMALIFKSLTQMY